ncbi:MAG: nitroreductase family deazaflavin-dependent oxidoreductase [Deltaproteobacteria bacterium]|nr:nitroreductase family deazaflavin-dependent oxidoreductase [Deltaproteobacteria bacterium]
MPLQNEAFFVAELTTVGRKTGLPRTIELRTLYLDGRFYASSANIEKKHWCRNMLKNPSVEIRTGNERFRCLAGRVTDEGLRRRVLSFRDSPPLMDREVFEMVPEGQVSHK